MPRISRIVYPGVPHHITHRGNNRENIFRSDVDKELYLSVLKKYSDMYDLKILGYCLMSNHIHIIGIPMNEDSMAKVIKIGHMYYTRRINEKYDRCGHLWHSRFYSVPLNDIHLLAAMRYIEQNPMRTRLVNFAWEYPWSSASAHVNGLDTSRILDHEHWHIDSISWKEILGWFLRDDEIELIRFHTKSGKPFPTWDSPRGLSPAEMLSSNTCIKPITMEYTKTDIGNLKPRVHQDGARV